MTASPHLPGGPAEAPSALSSQALPLRSLLGSRRPLTLLSRLHSCKPPRGPVKGAQLQLQLALKMGRAYVALFLFFNKVNIKNF